MAGYDGMRMDGVMINRYQLFLLTVPMNVKFCRAKTEELVYSFPLSLLLYYHQKLKKLYFYLPNGTETGKNIEADLLQAMFSSNITCSHRPSILYPFEISKIEINFHVMFSFYFLNTSFRLRLC